MKRRRTLAVGVACILVLANFSCSRDSSEPLPKNLEEIRVVSLNGLQQKLRACSPTDSCPSEVLQLGGIRRLAGLIVDRDNKDLILYGRMDEELPPLQLDDFVVALRNAWLKYAVMDGNTFVYRYPGCSIDQHAENIRSLQAIAHQIQNSKSFAGKEKQLEAWKDECEKPQAVTVHGIPFNTHFAQVMVKADYDLKQLADGSDTGDTPGFVSISDLVMHEATTALLQRRQLIQTPAANLNRFWLYPGENIYEEAEEAFFLKQSPVTLKTELMYTNAKGEVSKSHTAEPDAYRFAIDFTLLYGKLAYDKTIYQELEALFRSVSIAWVIKDVVGNNSAFDLNYLLDSYQVREVAVAQSLVGRHSAKEFKHRLEYTGGYEEVHFWLPSCGGVDIHIDESLRRRTPERTGRLAKLKAHIIASKPSPDALNWQVVDTGQFSLSELNAELWAMNGANKHNLAVGIVHQPDGYRVYDGGNEPLYAGDDVTELIRITKARAAADNNKVVQAFLMDFPDRKRVEAFLNTYETQSERYNLIKNPLADSAPDFIEQSNLVLRPGVQIKKDESFIEPVAEGEHKGRFKLAMSFIARAGRAIKTVTVHVITQTRQAAEAFLAAVLARFVGPNLSSTRTLADIINEAHREIEQQFGRGELIRIYVDQYGGKPQSKLVNASGETAS